MATDTRAASVFFALVRDGGPHSAIEYAGYTVQLLLCGPLPVWRVRKGHQWLQTKDGGSLQFQHLTTALRFVESHRRCVARKAGAAREPINRGARC